MVNASYVKEFYRKKINIHSFCTCMNHGKMVIVDDWVTVGSMNFDRLSFFHNRELNLVFAGDISLFKHVVEEIRTCCDPVDRKYFKKGGLKHRLYAFIGWFFRAVA